MPELVRGLCRLAARAPVCLMMAVPLFPPALTTNLVDSPVPSATVTGSVTNRFDQPVSNATVSLPELGLRTITDGRGNFEFTDLPRGTHIMVLEAGGYLPQAVTVEIERNGRVHVPILLHAAMGYAMT